MTSPIWLDENGQRRPTRPCPRCRLPNPVLRLRYEHLLMNGLTPMKTFTMLNWCGHGKESAPSPNAQECGDSYLWGPGPAP